MSRPSGDHAGGMFGCHGAISDTMGPSRRIAGQHAFLSAIRGRHDQLRRQRRRDARAQERDALTIRRPRDGAGHVADEQSGCPAQEGHPPDLSWFPPLLTYEVDGGRVGGKRRADERRARLRRDNLHVAGRVRLADPQAGRVAIALHVGDVAPVGRDRRPSGIAARRQLRDREIGGRRRRGWRFVRRRWLVTGEKHHQCRRDRDRADNCREHAGVFSSQRHHELRVGRWGGDGGSGRRHRWSRGDV